MQVEPSPVPVQTAALLDEFEASLVHERGLSKQTGFLYRYRIELLLHVDGKYRHRREGETPVRHPFDVATDDLKQHQLKHCRKPNTREIARKAFRSFFGWLVEEGYRADNPALKLKRAKPDKTLPKALSLAEAKKIEEAAWWEGVQEHALARLYLRSGLRLTEGVNLAWRQPTRFEDPDRMCSGVVDLEGGWILVRGKGSKERMVGISDALMEALKKAHKYRKHEVWVFPNKRGTRPICDATFYFMTKRWAKAAGIDPDRVSPHVLRHTFGTLLLNGEHANLAEIQSFLGHSNITTTMVYARVRPEQGKKAINRLRF